MTKTTDIYYPRGEIEKTLLKSIWRLSEYDLHKRTEIILPKGTVEIIFNFSDNIKYINPSLQLSKELPPVFINGINFKPFKLIKTGRQMFLGIQLTNAGLKLLFNISVREFNNRVYEGNTVCINLDALANELHDKQSFYAQVEIILKWIRKNNYALNYKYSIARVQKLMCLNYCHNVTVKKLSNEICLSDRQLRRFSQDWLGMNTEEFIHYNKYLTSLHLLHNSTIKLTEAGLNAGFYDQSHFIREFKSYTDLTPKQYREANTDLPGHIFV